MINRNSPLTDLAWRTQTSMSMEPIEAPEPPPPPFAQITLTELSEAMERLLDADPHLMRAVLRGLLYERDAASARVARALRPQR